MLPSRGARTGATSTGAVHDLNKPDLRAREEKAKFKIENKIHAVMRAIDDQKRLKEEMEEKEKKQLKKQLKLTQMQSDLKDLEDELE